MDRNELYHHGILGMRWGVRRYQNKDGSLTNAGKKRRKGQAEDLRAETIEEKKARILKSRSARELYKNADLFSDSELQRAFNRLMLEKNIENLAPKEVSRGWQFVNNMISKGRTLNEITDVGMKTYNNAAKLYNTFSKNGRTKPLPTITGDKKKK